MPHDYGGGVGDVEAVFGAALRNLDAAVAGIYRLLAHTLHLVAENDSVFFARLSVKLLKADACLLYTSCSIRPSSSNLFTHVESWRYFSLLSSFFNPFVESSKYGFMYGARTCDTFE